MKIKVSGLGEMIDYFEKVAEPPGPEVVEALDRVWGAAFLDTQARTHVLSGALKASGIHTTEHGTDQWEGTIQYGGAGAEQIIYEMARGGEHDPFSGMAVFDERIVEAMMEHFDE